MVDDKETTQSTNKTLKEIEEEIKRKQKELKKSLESPFQNVGSATLTTPKRGRPPNAVTSVDNTPVEVKQAEFSQRMTEIERPASDSSSESMRDWGEKEIHKLIPEAVADLKHSIKYGTAKERAEARAEIFRATGISQKEANNFGKGGGITINFGNGIPQGINLPFLQRTGPVSTVPVIETLTDAINKKKE